MDKKDRTAIIVLTAFIVFISGIIVLANAPIESFNQSDDNSTTDNSDSEDYDEYSEDETDYEFEQDDDYVEDNDWDYETYTTPMSEWGFNNLEDMDYRLLEIIGYHLNGATDDYIEVDCQRNKYSSEPRLYSLRFDPNGYYYKATSNIDKKTLEFDLNNLYTGRIGSKYTIVDNDTIVTESGDFQIIRRDLTDTDNRIVFVAPAGSLKLGSLNFGKDEEWYIPYNLVDFERGIFTEEGDDGEIYYCLYLKDEPD